MWYYEAAACIWIGTDGKQYLSKRKGIGAFMKKRYSDEDLRNILGKTNLENEVMDGRITETLEGIRENGQKGSAEKRRKSFWIKPARGFAAVAAALFLVVGLCVANPVLAAEIPVLGSIFERVRNVFSYGGMPEEETVQFQEKPAVSENRKEPESQSEAGGNFPVGADPAIENGSGKGLKAESGSAYQDTDNGFTITFTEYYATDQAIYLGVRVESEEELPQLATMGDTNYQLMQIMAREDYSFREDRISNAWPVEGRQEDAHTFVGIMRMDYEQIRVDDRRYNEACEEADEKGEPYPELNADTYDDWIDEVEIPEAFQVDMQIYRIWAYSTEFPSRYEKLGEWNFSFQITQSDTGMRSISVDEVNEQGIGVDHIELTPVELSVYTVGPKDGSYYTVALDRNGLALSGGNAYWSGETVKNEMITADHDISEITVYICDYDSYMEIDKTLMAPGKFREELEEQALFKTRIRTDGE